MESNIRKNFQIPIEINGKKFLIKPYTTKIEKDILIMSSLEIFHIDEVLRILDFDELLLKTLSENEKKVLLFKYREISLGDEIEVKFKCKHCNQITESVIYANDFVEESEMNDSGILKIDKMVTDENINDFLISEIDLNELELDVFEELKKRIEKNQSKFNFIKPCKCFSCQKENLFNLSDTKYIVEQLSDHTLYSIYKIYTNLMMFGNMTKTDIDNMYPFERTLFVGLITKAKESMAK